MAEARKTEKLDDILVPYYPDYKYIDKNLAPENIPMKDLNALANAQRKAEKAGVLSPEVAKYFLANALVEGRFSHKKLPNDEVVGFADYGVNTNRFPAKEGRDIVAKMGIADKTVVPPGMDEQQAMISATTGRPDRKPKGNPDDVYMEPQGDSVWNATLAASILGIKAAKAATPEEAIMRWNGQGKGAENHLKKVQAVQDMLAHPRNAAVLKMYQNALIGNKF